MRGAVFGRCADVDNVLRTVWDGPTPLYVRPSTPQQMRVVSTSAQDGVGGSGATSVMLRYLDANYIERQELIVMNGLTPVNTVATDILRINGLRVQTLGTPAGQTAGNVTVTDLAGTVTYSHMTAGGNSARQAVYTVPAGSVAYLSHWEASCGSAGEHYTRFVLSATVRDNALIPDVYLIPAEMILQNNSSHVVLPTPIRLPEKCDVRVLVISDSAAANVNAAASFGGWLEPTP